MLLRVPGIVRPGKLACDPLPMRRRVGLQPDGDLLQSFPFYVGHCHVFRRISYGDEDEGAFVGWAVEDLLQEMHGARRVR